MLGPHPSSPEPPRRQLLLAGGGHSHALLLRRWAMRPQQRPAATAITLVSRAGSSLYSGLVPGLVAGIYDRRQCAIDLRYLCLQAGVRFVQAEICGLETGDRRLLLLGRPPLPYDVLSLDVGAITAAPAAAAPDGSRGLAEGGDADAPAPTAMAVKPLEPFLAWCASLPPDRPVRLRGGGAAAVELALALRSRGHRCELLLRGDSLHLGSRATNRLGERLLARAGITVHRQVGEEEPADLFCTGSRAPAWLAAADLPVDPASGRVLTTASLQVCGHPDLFASGDCGLISTAPRPASGVWAVRAAPLLADNLRRILTHPQARLRRWRPQRWALQLLADGTTWTPPGRPEASPGVEAVALWGPWALGPSRWLGGWKDRIDRAFMARLAAALEPLPTRPRPTRPRPARPRPARPRPARPRLAELPAAKTTAMACRGCAAKLAAAPLAAALSRLQPEGSPPPPQDAVPLATLGDGALLLQSVDGFPALVEEAWLNARLTTLHACSDLWACGAQVESVQTLVTIPEAAPALQEEWLYQTLAGVRSVLDPLGAELLGGHTLEGRDGAGLALALTVQGRVQPSQLWTKGPLRAGDALLLSRPVGSGVLLAAARAGAADPDQIDALLEALQQSQAPLVELLAAHGCRACTDVTGFGLLGHLGEMLQGSPGVCVQLEAAAIPAWPGALALLEQGYASTLAPANGRALELLDDRIQLQSPPLLDQDRCKVPMSPLAHDTGPADEPPHPRRCGDQVGAFGSAAGLTPGWNQPCALDPAAAKPTTSRSTTSSPTDSRPTISNPGVPERFATADRPAGFSRSGPLAPERAALQRARRDLLLDPQTCGPLLAALPAAQAEAALQALRQSGFPQAAVIGTVVAA